MRPSDTDEVAAMILHWAFIVISAFTIGSALYGLAVLMMAAIP
jgi:hypothetical protein